MRVKGDNRLRAARAGKRTRRWLRRGLVVGGALLGVFIFVNVGMWLWYRGKVLPNYTLGSISVGGMPIRQLEERVPATKLLPRTVTLTKNDQQEQVATDDLGAQIDWPATLERLAQSRPWLPLLSVFNSHSVSTKLTVDRSAFETAAENFKTTFSKAPLPERIVFGGESFTIATPEPGYELDATKLYAELLAVLGQGKARLTVPTSTTHSSQPTGQLEATLNKLQKQLGAEITLVAGDRTKALNRAELGSFYEAIGQSMQPSAIKISPIIQEMSKQLGTTAINQEDAAQAILYAISKAQPVRFVLGSTNAKVYRYCTATRGVDGVALPEYRQKLAAVYGDPKGWNQDGSVFMYVESGCDFTAWLSAPSSMTSFGSICDSYYSCRVGPNVVVNYDRWLGATDPWNAAGGSLEDYRVMVINHETGHWLGFGHRNCPSPGQSAPVMQQQSISLQGCTFNPWPTAAEIASL